MEALAASGLLSEGGLAAAAAELDRTDAAPEGDVAIGAFLADRFGAELVDHVVGPLIGGINAGDVDELSLTAVTPQLAEAAADGGSLSAALAGRRRAVPVTGPVFHALLGGSGRLISALVDALRARGVQLRADAPLRELRRRGDGWELVVDEADAAPIQADLVVLTAPAPDTAELLAPHCPAASRELAAMTHSACALVTLVYRAEDVPTELDASGFLVPRSEGLFLTAASWGSSKWAHWDDGRHVVLRVSAGRTGDERQADMDDGELVDGLRADLATTMGITAAPVATRVARWELGFTQYTVGHLDRVGRIEHALEQDCPTLAVAGAAYRGLGLPACIHQGRGAVKRLLSR
jgi:oxygen-dependent protoporphyrinogen oxidase